MSLCVEIKYRTLHKRFNQIKKNILLQLCLTSLDNPRKLQKILQFVTGLSTVPPTGFTPQPSIAFVHEVLLDRQCKVFPTAHTCDNQLRLPVVKRHRTFRKFTADMEYAFNCVEGFCSETIVEDVN